MARHIWSQDLSTRTARLRLEIRKRPYSIRLGNGINQQYQRNKGPGSWLSATADGKGGQRVRRIGTADDYEDSNRSDVLSFAEAQDRILLFARRGPHAVDDGPVTLEQGIDLYRKDLETRGRDPRNASRILLHLPKRLLDSTILALAARDFNDWRTEAADKLTPQTFNRTAKVLAAALRLCARLDNRIDPKTWKEALRPIGGARRSHNVVLPALIIGRIITAAYRLNYNFGMLVETAASTGARVGQIKALRVRDLLAGNRLDMPRSDKGGGIKEVTHRVVQIPASLASKLRFAAKGRKPDELLLVKDDGAPWRRNDHSEPFEQAVTAASLDPYNPRKTIAALRHSHVTTMLLKNMPVRLVAELTDTSVGEIERTYGSNISRHSDDLARDALVDFAVDSDDVVVPMVPKR
jgi:integrase